MNTQAKMQRVSVRLSRSQKERLDAAAKRLSVSRSAIVRLAIIAGLAKEGARGKEHQP